VIAIRTIVLEDGVAHLQAGAESSPTPSPPPNTRSVYASSRPSKRRRSRGGGTALILLIDNYDSTAASLRRHSSCSAAGLGVGDDSRTGLQMGDAVLEDDRP